ncbi:hypothetical protein N657DRAFT_48994 [Parathielavia appendiculata]|uniref:Uncharacterized protein n=1 Tax=Parathielavia appendiculata TaxID=2587402 RepID=A0AAN6U9N0_9PEZI|nr:hypothetical protein N657DRAFT_48994 [Parathielavia appendiculata]
MTTSTTSLRIKVASVPRRRSSVPISHAYTVEIEYSSEDEIEDRLAHMLSAYRAFYLEPDEREPQTLRDAVDARTSRRILKRIFHDHLNSAEDEDLLLQREEEDVLDMLLRWVRETQMPSRLCRETFDELAGCVGRLDNLASALFVKGVYLSFETKDGSMFMVHLPPKGFNDAKQWDFGEVYDVFGGLGQIDNRSESKPIVATDSQRRLD